MKQSGMLSRQGQKTENCKNLEKKNPKNENNLPVRHFLVFRNYEHSIISFKQNEVFCVAVSTKKKKVTRLRIEAKPEGRREHTRLSIKIDIQKVAHQKGDRFL